MKKSNMGTLSLVGAAVAVTVGSVALAQDDELQTEEVRRAAEQLERAEDRLESAEGTVEQREEELEQAIAEAAESEQPASSDRFSDTPEWDESDWEQLTEEHGDLSTFVEGLRLTGLDDALTSGPAYTVFAPINEAFDEERDDLLSDENREELTNLLRAHIVADDVDPNRARTLDEALTIDGGTIDISVEEDDELGVGDAKVVESDIRRGNLRIYLIDELLERDPTASSIALGELDED